MKINTNGIAIEVEDSGPGTSGQVRPVVLLIMGLGMQLVAWPLSMLRGLDEAGYRVVRFDNRDVGLSSHLDHLGRPNLIWQGLRFNLGLSVRAPYGLADMARDALGVMDGLGIARAHVVGVSMGGMIAQRMAIDAPQRLLSLTSIMSTSGDPRLPRARPHVIRTLLARPEGQDEQALVRHYVHLYDVIGSPGYPQNADELVSRIRASVRRSYNPAGVARQMVASVADVQRPAQLAGVRVPTLILHGKDDPLVPLACGEDTARRIPGARFEAFAGMGHDLAPGVVDLLMRPLLPHLAAA
jgi:pimeloyl-ACP methyl ester carboxylesterase